MVPIAGVTGTLDRPRVRLDRNALAALAAEYATGAELNEALDKTLGPGTGEAVQGLLEQLLKGGRKR